MIPLWYLPALEMYYTLGRWAQETLVWCFKDILRFAFLMETQPYSTIE